MRSHKLCIHIAPFYVKTNLSSWKEQYELLQLHISATNHGTAQLPVGLMCSYAETAGVCGVSRRRQSETGACWRRSGGAIAEAVICWTLP